MKALPNTLRTALVSALVLGLTTTAFAGGGGEKATLKTWAQEASVAVDRVMKYPTFTGRSNAEGLAEFRVTIDDEGNVLSSDMTDRPGNFYIRRAAKRVVSAVDLPDLPGDYETLTFKLRLNYAIESGFRPTRSSGTPRVSSRRIAQSSAPLTAGIEVVSATVAPR